jgi:hypothetical protein
VLCCVLCLCVVFVSVFVCLLFEGIKHETLFNFRKRCYHPVEHYGEPSPPAIAGGSGLLPAAVTGDAGAGCGQSIKDIWPRLGGDSHRCMVLVILLSAVAKRDICLSR